MKHGDLAHLPVRLGERVDNMQGMNEDADVGLSLQRNRCHGKETE